MHNILLNLYPKYFAKRDLIFEPFRDFGWLYLMRNKTRVVWTHCEKKRLTMDYMSSELETPDIMKDQRDT